MSEDILVMKKSLIASLVISSIAFTGLGSVSSSFAQSTPSSDPTMTPGGPGGPTTPGGSGEPKTPGSSGGADTTVPGGSMPSTTPNSSPDMLKKPVKKNVKKKKKTTSKSTVPVSKTAKPATSGY